MLSTLPQWEITIDGSAVVQALLVLAIAGAAKLLLNRMDGLDKTAAIQKAELGKAIAEQRKSLGDELAAHRKESGERFEIMNGKLEGVNKHLSTLNGSVATMKEWQRLHERVDDERHEEIKDAIKAH